MKYKFKELDKSYFQILKYIGIIKTIKIYIFNKIVLKTICYLLNHFNESFERIGYVEVKRNKIIVDNKPVLFDLVIKPSEEKKYDDNNKLFPSKQNNKVKIREGKEMKAILKKILSIINSIAFCMSLLTNKISFWFIVFLFLIFIMLKKYNLL